MPNAEGEATIPTVLCDSALLRTGGAIRIDQWLSQTLLNELTAQAEFQLRSGERIEVKEASNTCGRGGVPGRAFRTAHGTSLQLQLHSAQSLIDHFSEFVGAAIHPSGGGSFSSYEREGDFLGLHRDIPGCDVALLTCLSHVRGMGRGQLHVYPDGINQNITGENSCWRPVHFDLDPGESVLLLGGFVPHRVTPMGSGQIRVMSVMCYRLLIQSR